MQKGSRRSSQPSRSSQKELRLRPKYFFFFDKRTGAARFRIAAANDGSLPVDEAASLLALHCLAHRHTPRDYGIVFGAGDGLLTGVSAKAEKLLKAVGKPALGVRLSRREQEVLDGVLRNLTNKEIGGRLNLSERTVKFHMAALFAKFGVHGRVALMREAIGGLLPPGLDAASPSTRFTTPAHGPQVESRSQVARPDTPSEQNRVVSLSRQQLTA